MNASASPFDRARIAATRPRCSHPANAGQENRCPGPPSRTCSPFSALGGTDGDGLSDADEVTVHGTDPFDADSDDDGRLDGDELSDGTDPLDAFSPDPTPASAIVITGVLDGPLPGGLPKAV